MKAETGKRYKHYKNGKEYTVLALAHHSETLEKLVIYQAEYETEDLGSRPIFARPQDMFEETIDVNGKMMDRFERIG